MHLELPQLREPENRHLVDVRGVDPLPPHRIIERVRVVEPEALAALEASAIAARAGREKGISDRLDLAPLLRAFPELRDEARIADAARRHGVAEAGPAARRELAASRRSRTRTTTTIAPELALLERREPRRYAVWVEVPHYQDAGMVDA